jgi:hypothetical protein
MGRHKRQKIAAINRVRLLQSKLHEYRNWKSDPKTLEMLRQNADEIYPGLFQEIDKKGRWML